MAECITLNHFNASQRHYHIHCIHSSNLAEKPHYHNYYQVCFVTRGEILHQQERHTVRLVSGDAFIIPPGFLHNLHFCNTDSELYSLAFEDALFHAGFQYSNAYQFLSGFQYSNTWQFLSELQSETQAQVGQNVRLRVLLNEDQCKTILTLMECLIRQQQADCPQELSAAPSLISSILYLLAQSYYQQPQNADQFHALESYNSTLLACTRYIDQHYKEPLSLVSVSKQFGLSRSVFCTLFPQFTGMPLRQYISQKRIQEAQMLIRSHPEWPLHQISAEVGYEDTSTFYRNFLRITNISPSRYRELCITDQESPASPESTFV